MSGLLFNIVIDWVMSKTTEDHLNQMDSHMQDLDFADDLSLLSHTHKDIQERHVALTITTRWLC
uniref:Reverse transcriptase domain-containing protein n=1 Tax=Arion vulgaris TaxID=1028688 RepID=A0A0B7ADY4_9EUPU